MTYGQLKFQLTKAFPGVDLDLIEGWIDERYAEILGELPWSRQNLVGVLQTIAPYSTGTVTLANGSTSVSLSGGTFAPNMTGMAFTVTGEDDIYAFSYISATTGSLDRPYEGSLALPGAGFTLFQHIYPMPADCRMLEDTAFANFSLGPLKRFSRAQLNQSCPAQGTLGTPFSWASYMDDGSVPPRIQVQLYPAPNVAMGIPFQYISDPGALSANAAGTSAIIQTWMQPAALKEGVIALIKAHLKDTAGAQFAAVLARAALARMRSDEAQGSPAAEMQLDRYYTSYRSRRWTR